MMAAFAAFAAISCAKEIREETPVKPDDNKVDAPVVWTLSAGFKAEENDQPVAPASRTALNGTKMSWSVGDKINVNGVESLALTAADIEEDAALAHFQFTAVPQGDELIAVYPASAAGTYQDTLTSVNFPATQSYDPETQAFDPNAAILLGSGTGTSCSFQHGAVYLKFTCDQPVKSIRIMANSYRSSDGTLRAGMAVSGIRTVNFEQPFLTDAVLKDIGTSTTVDLGEGVAAGTPIVVAVPPRDYRHGLNFMVVTSSGKYQVFRSENAIQLAGKLGKIMSITLNLNDLKTYEGPGIYSGDDYEAFVYSYEAQNAEMMDRFRDGSGVFHLRANITGANFTRLGANAGTHAGDTGTNIHFAHEFDGHGYSIHQDSSSVALFSTVDASGYIHDLELTGKFTKIANHGWGTANLVIRNFGELRNCVNRMDISIDETVPLGSGSTKDKVGVFLTGLVLSNGGVMRDCINYGKIEANLDYTGQNHPLIVGAIACVGNYEGSCGNFENCENYGNITITKQSTASGGYSLTRSLQCGIGGICGKVDDGSIASRGNPNVEEGKYYAKETAFCFFENCHNEGNITYWEDGNSNNSPLAIGGILGRCCKTSSDGTSFSFSGLDGYYLIINYNCRNTGTIDVSSSAGQLAAFDISGARELYIGGIAGVVHGICTKSGGYAVIRGRSDCTIKVGGTRGGEVAGGIIGGACLCKVEMSTASIKYEKTDNTLFTPTKAGLLGACLGLVIKRCVIYGGSSLEHSNAQYSIDASALNGYTVVGTGFGGVTSNSSTYKYHNKWDATTGDFTDAEQTTPYIILEGSGTTNYYFNFTGKKPDGTSFTTGEYTKTNKADCDVVYGPAGSISWRSDNVHMVVNAAS